MYIHKNFYGIVLHDKDTVELADPKYGTGKRDKYGMPIVDWDYYITGKSDKKGFDLTNTEENGKYYCYKRLPKDTILQRFGTEHGHYTSPANTPYEVLALPYKIETLEYNEYKVIADGIKVRCVVRKGKTAPSQNSRGGAIQYYHKDSIRKLIKAKKIERVD